MDDNSQTSSSREKAIERIKKMLRLSKSANPNEAAVALNMAVKKMKELGLSFSDIGVSSIKSIYVRTPISSGIDRIPLYENIFLNLIVKAFGVKMLLRIDEGKKYYHIYGPTDRVEVAAYSCEVLARQLKSARKKYMADYKVRHFWLWPSLPKSWKTAMGDSYAEGWVAGMKNHIDVFYEVTPEEQKCMDDFLKKEGKVKPAGYHSCNYRDEGYDLGYAHGSDAYLNTGVNHSFEESRQLTFSN